MKKAIQVGIIMALISSSSLAWGAGAESGGGGNAVVCRDTQGRILSAELQDLFEARVEFGLNITQSDLPYRKQFDAAFNRIRSAQMDPFNSDWSEEFPKYIANDPTFLPAGVGLGEIGDYDPVVVPKGCKVERLAYYDDRFDRLLVDSEIWNKLGETDRAALLVHENLYLEMRLAGEKTSDRVRYEVGVIFSDLPLENVFNGIPKDAKLHNCLAQPLLDSQSGGRTSHVFRFVAFRVPSGTTAASKEYRYYFKFYVFNDLPLIFPKTAFFDGPDFTEVLGAGDYSELLSTVKSKFGPEDELKVQFKRTDGGRTPQVFLSVTDGFYPHEPIQVELSCDNLPAPVIN